VLSVLPDVTPLRIVEAPDEAPVIIPKPSPLPEDLLADDGLREENAALAARLDEATRALETLRAQALQDGVAAQHHLGLVGRFAGRPAGRSTGTGRRLARRRMAGAHVRRRGGAAALQPAPAHTTGTDRRALLGALFADGAATLGIAGHR
jgi:hypothetical protein